MAKEEAWPIELYEWPEGSPVDHDSAVALLQVPGLGHLPAIGDIVSWVSDDGIVRYRVVGREFMFNGMKRAEWMPYSKVWLYVRKMPWDEQPSVIH